MTSPSPAAALQATPTVPGPSTSGFRGRGARLIERWTRSRRAAGLPEPSEWDGALVTMSISLLTGRDVREQGRRFALGRRSLLTPGQIELDLTLGLEALDATAADADVAPIPDLPRNTHEGRSFRGSGALPVPAGIVSTVRRWRPSSLDLAAVRAAALSGIRLRRQTTFC